ncbi:MAG: hypothetical protein HY308_08175 [Gammaproteobacteria bacterium]|nr:hypothetical protein [Gammaproteobacteria bacterium]
MTFRHTLTLFIFVLSLGLNQADFAAETATRTIRVAALDSLEGPPPCGQDNKCNIAVCPNDPDCPADLPKTSTTTSTDKPDRPSDINDCTSKEVTEIGLAIDFGADHWQEYKAVLEDIRDWPVTIGNCLENRFKKNGKVVCEKSMGGSCTDKNGTNNGWAVFSNKRCHMCPDFLNRIKNLPDPVSNRQACYFALVTHEWGHTCERGHKTLEIIDDEAFNFWKSKHPDVTITFSDCGMR